METAVKKMGRGKRLFLIITSVVLALILIATLCLGLIKTKGLYDLAGYRSVEITNSDGVMRTIFSSTTDEDEAFLRDEFNKGLKKTRYSILRGWLEGIGRNSYRFETYEKTEDIWNDDDELETVTTTEKVEVKRSDILNSFGATADGYKLLFKYDELKSITVKGETISFDRLGLVVAVNSANIIEEYMLYPYEFSKMSGVENEAYKINPVKINAKAFELYQIINDTIFPYFL